MRTLLLTTLILAASGICQAYSVAAPEQEGRQDALATFYDADKEAFMAIFDSLLWDADEPKIVDNDQARHFADDDSAHYHYRRGLLRMPMPSMFRREDNFAGQMYRGFAEQCYSWICKLGLGGLASSLNGLFGF